MDLVKNPSHRFHVGFTPVSASMDLELAGAKVSREVSQPSSGRGQFLARPNHSFSGTRHPFSGAGQRSSGVPASATYSGVRTTIFTQESTFLVENNVSVRYTQNAQVTLARRLTIDPVGIVHGLAL